MVCRPVFLSNENHQQCWWFQKALAMRRKIPPLMYNKNGLPTKNKNIKGGSSRET